MVCGGVGVWVELTEQSVVVAVLCRCCCWGVVGVHRRHGCMALRCCRVSRWCPSIQRRNTGITDLDARPRVREVLVDLRLDPEEAGEGDERRHEL